ncbi:hypothetical protein BDV25DRAFT_159004 [Aspergillus avenaceus]|uniref:N-acetylgalactosaminide beta-1,3-galactosyltransferase n=1 Tax=Aspergillus avenaceus TaxID=36643 RepID=A0A5N6TP90_ASPAV|nr:hypothetical protein BDV25DRAFT_159004 [Aspergillus avenaceus]
MLPPRRFRRIAAITAVFCLFLVYHFYNLRSDYHDDRPATTVQDRRLPECPPLPGMEDILVVLKTGVTEALDKVPVHFQTTLRCVPNYVIFSDFEEDINGIQVHDAFKNMDPDVKNQVPDFDLYNRLLQQGRAGLATGDFADEANSAIGKPNNPGWKLDKWKFLPMVQETLRYKGDAKWYVFMEADTYYSWGTLIQWLSHFDASKPWYIGTETQIADVIFAHGGSGFAVSNPAMQRVSKAYTDRNVELNEYTDAHWAGDCVLGKVLADEGVPLHFSWPILQNTNIGELDEFTTAFYRQPWCYPAVAFHHLSARDIQDLHNFETRRYQEKKKTLLLHSDVFKEIIYPDLSPIRDAWDNLSDEEHPEIPTFHECQSLCRERPDCAQFAFRAGKCYTGKSPRLGSSAASDIRSGWVMKKVEEMVGNAPVCKNVEWGA